MSEVKPPSSLSQLTATMKVGRGQVKASGVSTAGHEGLIWVEPGFRSSIPVGERQAPPMT